MSRVLGLLCLEGGLDDPPGHLPETVSGDSDSKVVTVTCQLDIQRSQIHPGWKTWSTLEDFLSLGDFFVKLFKIWLQ